METLKPKRKVIRLAQLAFLAWIFLSLYAGIYAAEYLWLFRLYGFSRVCTEHLHFVSTPKGGDWIVSNGDHVTEGFFVNHFLVALVIWLVLFFAPFPFLFRRKNREKNIEAIFG
jgi:hypothetical protein